MGTIAGTVVLKQSVRTFVCVGKSGRTLARTGQTIPLNTAVTLSSWQEMIYDHRDQLASEVTYSGSKAWVLRSEVESALS